MSKHIWCIDTNTAGTNSLTVVAGRLGRVYMTQEEKEQWEKNPQRRGIAYLIQPGTIQEQERNHLESRL